MCLSVCVWCVCLSVCVVCLCVCLSVSVCVVRVCVQVIEELQSLGRADMVVVCGGVIPPQDYDTLFAAGVTAVYGPGTNITTAARELVQVINKNLSETEKKKEKQL